MAQQEQTVFQSFDNGLDSFTNPHRLNPTAVGVAIGLAQDRPGYIYPGPGYAATAWTQTFTNAFGAFGYATLALGNADSAVFWGIQSGNLPIFTGWAQPDNLTVQVNTPPVYPFRQQLEQLKHGSPYLADTENATPGAVNVLSIISPPQVATTSSYRITAWQQAESILCTFTHLKTGISSNLTILTIATPPINGWAICATSAYFYLVLMNTGGSSAVITSYLISEPLESISPTLTAASTSSTITCTAICASGQAATGPGEPDAAIFVFQTAGTLSAITASGASFGSQTTIATGTSATKPITVSVGLTLSTVNNDLLTASAFLFAYYTSSSVLTATSCTLALGSITSVTPALTTPYSTCPTVSIPTQLSISFVDGGANTLGIAAEFVPPASIAISGASAATYAYILLLTSSFSAPSVSTVTPITAWGGLALAGRMRLHQWAVNPDATAAGTTNTTSVLTVFIPTRSGWRSTDGSWGTSNTAGAQPAYPTGFLYDLNSNLVAKFGDADVGSDSLWPEFASSNYRFLTLPTLTEASVIFGSLQQQGSLSYPFPQYFDFLTIADHTSGSTTAVRADIGAIIGAFVGPSIATWIDASYLSPPAPAVQQGSTVTIAGALTVQFDGSGIVEAGWLMAAPTPIVFLETGGSLPIGEAPQYLSVLVATDANGKIYRSAPSYVTQAPAATSGHQQYTVWMPAMYQTLRKLNSALQTGGLAQFNIVVSVEIYRNVPTQSVNPGTFYRLPVEAVYYLFPEFTSGKPTFANFFQNITVNNPDTTLDQDLINCLQLYTTGSLQGASIGTNNPLSFDCMANWNNATWGIARRNGAFELWFTWPQDNNILRSEGPTWNENNRIPLPSSLGIPRALVPMDTQLIVLGSLADYTIQGNGPNRATTYADDSTVYTTPAALPGSGGIQTLNGATIIPQGAIFQGQQGFTLLDRGLNYTVIGNEVRTFTNQYKYLPGVILPAMQAVLLYAATPPGTITADTASIYPDLMYFYNTTNWSQIEHPVFQGSPNLLTANQADGTDTTADTTGFVLGQELYGDRTANGATIASTTSYEWQGLRSLLFNGTGTSEDTVGVKLALTLQPNTEYTFSFYILEVSGSTGLYAYALDSSNNELTNLNLTTTGAWVRQTLTFITGTNTGVELGIEQLSPGSGEFAIDGLQLELGPTASTWMLPLGPRRLYGPIVGTAKVLSSNGTFALYPATTDGGVNQQITQYSQYVAFQTPWIEMTAYMNPTTGGLNPVRNPADYGTIREVQLIMDTLNQGSYAIETTLTVVAEFDYVNNTATPPQTQTLTVTTQPGDTQFRWGLNASQCRRVRLTVTIDGAAGSSNGPQPMFLITGLEIGYATDAGLSRLGTPNSSNF